MKLVYHKIIALLLLSALQSPSAFAEELADILRNALRNDPALLEASANTEGAYNEMEASKAGHYPTFSLTGQNVVAQQNTSNNSRMRDDVGIKSRLNLYAWGGIQAAVERDKHKMEYYQHKYYETREELANTISTLYLTALRAKESIAVAKKNIKRHEKFLADLRVISEYDSGRRSEMTQAQSRYLQAQSTEASLQKTLSVTLSKLNKYSSKRLTEKDIVDPFNKQNSAQLIALFDKVPITAHPSVKAQESEYSSALSDAEVAKASKYPSINLEGSATRHDRSVAVTMTWDLYNKSADYALEKSHAVIRSARARSDELLRDIQERAETAKVDMKQSEQRAKIVKSLISTQSQVAQDYEQQFYISHRTLLEVLDSYAELAATETNYVEAQNDYRDAAVAYLLAKASLAKWAKIPDFNANSQF